MKRTLIVIVFIILSLLILSSCQDEVFTYDNPGTISIEISNEGISASDVVVRASSDSEIEKSGKIITISQNQLLRTVVTLSVEGHISKVVVIKSLDFNENGEYSTSITFEEDYISLELTLITEAPSGEIEIESENILSYKSHGNIYDIKLSNNETPQINISAGESFREYDLTLTQEEIEKGISSRTIMLLDYNHTMVVLNVPLSHYINYQTEDYQPLNEFRKGNQALYSVNNNSDVSFYVYDEQYNYIGEKSLTSEMLSEHGIISLDIDHLDLNILLNITPYITNYISEYWYVIAEKENDEFIPIFGTCWNGYPAQYSNVISPAKEYYVFTMGDDGKIRYKKINMDDISKDLYNSYSTDLIFDNEDPVRDISVEIIDFNGGLTDFTGVEIKDDLFNSLATISSGNTADINPSNIFHYLTLENLPLEYEYYRVDSLYLQPEEFFFDLAIEGVYKAYVYQPFSLTIHIDSDNSYEGYYCEEFDSTYYVDNNNTITIDNYKFNCNYQLSNGVYTNWDFHNKTKQLKVSDIILEGGSYHATITLDEYN